MPPQEQSTPLASPHDTKPKRRSRISEERCRKILASALRAFSMYGLHGARIETIAEEAGLSKTNLLYYYPSKEQLYREVLTQTLDTWLAPMKAFEASQEALDAIDHYIQVKLAASRDNPLASRLFCMEMMQGAPEIKGILENELKQVVDEKSLVVKDWIAQGKLNPIDPIQLFFLLWASTQHYADFSPQVEALTRSSLNDPDFFENALDTLRRTILAGLTPFQKQ